MTNVDDDDINYILLIDKKRLDIHKEILYSYSIYKYIKKINYSASRGLNTRW